MLNWLKFISSSIVSNKSAKQAANRSFWNVLLFLFVNLILLSFFYSLSFTTTFKYQYGKAAEFKSAMYEIFTDTEINGYVNKQGEEFVLTVAGNDNLPYVYNSVLNTDEKINDFHVIIDTRAKSYLSYVEYTPYYSKRAIDISYTISLEKYVTTTDVERQIYNPMITAKETLVDLELIIPEIDIYFNSIKENNTEIYDKYNAIKSDNELELSVKNNRLYELYLNEYYGIKEKYLPKNDEGQHVQFDVYYSTYSLDNGTRISFENWNKLASSDRSQYYFTPEYTNNIFDTYSIYQKMCDHFIGLPEDQRDATYQSYQSIIANTSLTDEEKAEDLYPFYISNYYGVSTTEIPNLYNLYINVVSSSHNENLVFPRMILLMGNYASFTFVNQNNYVVAVSDNYSKVGAFDFRYPAIAGNEEAMKNNVDSFVLGIFQNTSGFAITMYLIIILVNVYLRLLFYMLILALFMFIMVKISNDDYAPKYSQCFKVVSATILSATFLSSLVCFIISFFVNQGTAFSISIAVFNSILISRVLYLVISSYFKHKKQLKNNQPQTPKDKGTKDAIDVSDERETMEFM